MCLYRTDKQIMNETRCLYGTNKEIMNETGCLYGINKEIMNETRCLYGTNKEIMNETKHDTKKIKIYLNNYFLFYIGKPRLHTIFRKLVLLAKNNFIM